MGRGAVSIAWLVRNHSTGRTCGFHTRQPLNYHRRHVESHCLCWCFQTRCRRGSGELFWPPREPSVLRGRRHNAAQRLESFWKNLAPSKQSRAACEPKSSSLFLAIAASQALVDTVSVCILKRYFPALSLSVDKSRISKHLLLFFLPALPILCFVTLKVPQSLKTLLIHTNDWPLFEAIENACTSCWEERGGKKQRWESRCGKSIELKWNYLSVGKANSVLIEWLDCFRERGEEDRCALNPWYSTHTLITWELRPMRKRQLCFAESSAAVFTNLAIYFAGFVASFAYGRWVFILHNLMSLISEEYCVPPPCTEFICFPGKVYYSHLTIGLACSDKLKPEEDFSILPQLE